MDERIERARAHLAERERTLAHRDASIAEIQAALGAGSPLERHRLRVKQLRTSIAEVKREADGLRARIAAHETPPPVVRPAPAAWSPERAHVTGAIIGAVFLVGILSMIVCGR